MANYTQDLSKQNTFKVEAYLFGTDTLVGIYDNCSQAAKKLFIRRDSSIYKAVTLKPKRHKGIASYKDGRIFKFKKHEQK